MDQSVDIKNEPTNSTSSDHLEIPNEMQVENVKQESDCLAQSKFDIKTEPQEDESDFLEIAGTSHDMCHNIEAKVEIIDNAYEDLFEEVLQDLLEDTNEIEDKTTLNKKQKMDERKSSEIKNIKNESTNTISTSEMQMNGVEEEISEFSIGLAVENVEHPPSESDVDARYSTEETDVGENDKYNLLSDDEISSDNKFSKKTQFLERKKQIGKNKSHVCHVCHKAFKKKDCLNKHSRVHTGTKPFTCKVCKETFIQKSNLNTHLRIHNDEKSYDCNVCKNVFRHKSNFNQHKLIHSNVKSYSCKECNKAFKQKSHLVSHKRIHSGEKPFTCDVCKKAFAVKSNLTSHRRTHTGERPYTCDICKKSFTQKAHLNKHKKNHNN